jgi:hypothetical protein
MRKQLLKLRNDEMILAEARVDAENKRKKNQKKVRCIPNLRNMHELRSFTIGWFDGIIKALTAAYKSDADEKAQEAKLVSRTDLSLANESESRSKTLDDKTVTFTGKGFFGPPLPLIPDIRKSEVSEGVVGQLLEALGVSKRFERVVTLSKGPNKRSNRYLVYQYKRLIKSIDGTLVKGDSNKPPHVIWAYNIYKLTNPNLINDAEKMEVLKLNGYKAPNKWTSLKDYVKNNRKVNVVQTNLDLEIKNLKRAIKRKARLYWSIAQQLIRCSIAFRIAVLQKILGKTGRWFHRDFDIEQLFEIFGCEKYQNISDKFDSNMEMKRTWISTEMRDGSFKWRPLGIADYPWRIFTRGINNFLETFLSGSWPKNQHGYKSGRGVHTAWNQILRTIINAKFIFEFDFAGFFNTVRMEAIGNTLNRFLVPKTMIAYLINVSAIDIKNISPRTRNRYLKTRDPTKQGWASAWFKYEYIHLYRKGYRSMGLPQGFAISPLLSVLTLIVLEDLEKQDIFHILYADDGLFYSDHKVDYLKVAQDVLDKHGIGAYFNLKKSKSVKENGVWLDKLKFVGLIYDPFKDMLSADTRNGATLKLKVGAVGYFAEKELSKNVIPDIQEIDHFDWENTNEKLFAIYENIYLNKSYKSHVNDEYLEEIKKTTVNIIKKRFSKYSLWDFTELQKMDGTIDPVNFLFPIRLLHNICKEAFHEQLQAYNSWMGSPFPWDLLFKDLVLTEKFWMDLELDAKDYDIMFKSKLMEKNSQVVKDDWWQSSKVIDCGDSSIDNASIEKILDNLKWFHQLDEVPDAIVPQLKDGELELGEWLELKLSDLDVEELPKVVVDNMRKYGGKFAFTQLTWRNLYMDPIFATFIARLFQDSFRSGVSKQSFRLTTDRKSLTLVKIIDSYAGRNRWVDVLNGGRFDIFNSSSFCSNLFIKLAESWLPHVKSKRAFKVPIHIRTYKKVLHRIINRRSMFLGTLHNDFQLSPTKVELSDSNIRTRAHLKYKYRNIQSLQLQSITRSTISTHEINTTDFEAEKG